MAIQLKQRSVLPGFGLTMGLTMTYLSLLVLIPLAGLFLKSATISWPQFWAAVTDAARGGLVQADLRRVAGGGDRSTRCSA